MLCRPLPAMVVLKNNYRNELKFILFHSICNMEWDGKNAYARSMLEFTNSKVFPDTECYCSQFYIYLYIYLLIFLFIHLFIYLLALSHLLPNSQQLPKTLRTCYLGMLCRPLPAMVVLKNNYRNELKFILFHSICNMEWDGKNAYARSMLEFTNSKVFPDTECYCSQFYNPSKYKYHSFALKFTSKHCGDTLGSIWWDFQEHRYPYGVWPG